MGTASRLQTLHEEYAKDLDLRLLSDKTRIH